MSDREKLAKTNKEKQEALRERRAKAGLKRKEYWATEAQHKKLRRYLEELKGT